MTRWEFTKGLHDIGNGHWAYLQPDGGWGYSNAGLVTDGDESLLVDTLFDERLTAEMLEQIHKATGLSADDLGTLVNTHSNGDHTHGNALVDKAEIIASEASAREMAEVTPEMLAGIMRNTDDLGDAGEFFRYIFSDFDLENVRGKMPTRTFTGRLDLKVGDKDVHIIEVGPAHTEGDVLIHVPKDKVIYTGDILFIDGTPIMWAGPVSNWIDACEQILAMDVEIIVPGHGPVTDKEGVRRVRDYLTYIDAEARKCFDAGLSVEEAVSEISLGDFSSWLDAERIVVNVDELYREYRGDTSSRDVMKLFGMMGRLVRQQRG